MNPNPLSESDLDRLEQLLDADVFAGESMRLDEIKRRLSGIDSGQVAVEHAV